MTADSQTQDEVLAALHRMTGAYRKRDLEGVMAAFGSDPDVMLFGTGADEVRRGKDAIRTQVQRDWGQTDEVSLALRWGPVSAAGDVAWAWAEGTFDFRAGDVEGSLPARLSAVLERRDGQWLIVHSHFSTPAAAQVEGESF
jgi:ketosteroid isomerase-like protein